MVGGRTSGLIENGEDVEWDARGRRLDLHIVVGTAWADRRCSVRQASHAATAARAERGDQGGGGAQMMSVRPQPRMPARDASTDPYEVAGRLAPRFHSTTSVSANRPLCA